MKKITSILLLLPFFIMAQINVDNQWRNSVNPIFQNLNKSKIQSGILLDYAMEFTDVTAYNGVLTDTTFVDINVLGDIYKTLFMAKVVADTVHTPLYDRYAYNWARDRYKATKDSSSLYVLSGLLYEYQKFNENALVQNKITVSANKYYDKFIRGVWQNPYETRKTFALTTPIQQSRSKKVYFKLPSSLFLSNLKNQIANIQINADNGQGYKNFPFNVPLKLDFFENKIHNITYKLTLTNNQVLYCRSKFKIDDPTLNNLQQRGAIPVTNERVYIYEDGNFFNAAWLTIRRIPANVATNRITRPFIIAEGLDTGNFTAPEDFGGDNTMQNFLIDLNTAGSNLRALIDAGDFNNSYDLIYIDWVRGMADMRANSRVLEEVIKWVNNQKVIGASGVLEPNVLLGQSMGGVIGRYTLARMEKEFKPHNVRLFIAHDSPMQGANTPIGLQHFSVHMRQEYVSTPLLWGVGEVILPLGFSLAQLGEQFLNLFGGNNNNIPAYVTPSELLSLQDQTASRQLNYWSVLNNQTKTRSFNLDWQNTLTTMGWPQLSRNVAISNGNECNISGELVPGTPLLIIDSTTNPGFFLDALSSLLAPTTALITQDIGLLLVSAIPGNSKWQTNFNINSSGNQGSQNLIYFGRIRYSKKFLWLGPTITHDLTNRSYYSPSDALPFESYSSGQYRLTTTINGLPSVLSDLIDFSRTSYGFIPTVSALDIKRNNGEVIPSDYFKRYAGGSTPEPALTSGFVNFIVDFNNNNSLNNRHISFQVRNGDWLASELEETPVVADCTFICSGTTITGSNTFCASSTYSIPNIASFYNWTVTQGGSLVSLSANETSSITLTRNGNSSGQVTLQLTYGDNNVRCGNVAITKTIWIGNPSFNYVVYGGGSPSQSLCIAPANSYSFSIPELNTNNKVTANFNGISLSEINSNTNWEWMPLNELIMLNGSKNSREVCAMGAGQTGLKFRAKNSCGWSEWTEIYFEITENPYQGFRQANTDLFTIYPNPSKDIVTIELKDKNNQPKKDTTIHGELYDMMGISKSKVKIKDNKAVFSVNGLNKGIYVLKIFIDDTVENHQIAVE